MNWLKAALSFLPFVTKLLGVKPGPELRPLPAPPPPPKDQVN